MSAMIAPVAGRVALFARPARNAKHRDEPHRCTDPSATNVTADATSAPSNVARRPTRSASTPPTTAETPAPTAFNAATNPAKAAECPNDRVK